MNKTAIKNFAVRARNKLIEDITQKSYELGITKKEIKDIEAFEGGFKIKGLDNSKIYKKYELKQRDKLVANINDKGFEQVIEEVAYTWFNRFIALRFMEVNEYLPSGVRVLSSIEEGKTEPDIIGKALEVDLDIDHEIVYKIMDKKDRDDLYKYLFIKQCNQLGQIMPMVFEEISDYTELLLPDNLLLEGSVIRDLVESVDEEDYKDQVEIIGWMYQYYISEKKDEVFADLKKNKKITKENIPAATQLFTPKWIVKYMVENSLGRLWLESHPDEELKAQWKYYLEEAEQDPEVQKQLDELKNPNLNPQDIKVLDPAMGSGHILVYAFDVLYDIYSKANYSEREIPQLILEKNLYGLDIDDRAGQLAAFALMMKARSRNRRIFRNKIELNICSIQESNGIPREAIEFLVSPKDTGFVEHFHKEQVEYLIEIFHDAKEYGSILDVEKIDFDAIERRIEEIRSGDTLNLFELNYREVVLEKIPPLVKQGRIMSDKYDVVCTNPPYMGRSNMNSILSSYGIENYNNSSNDLYSMFIDLSFRSVKKGGYVSIITMHYWMFTASFYNFRQDFLENTSITLILHLGMEAFEEVDGKVVSTVAIIARKLPIIATKKISGIRLVDFYDSKKHLKAKEFFNKNNHYSESTQGDYLQISGYPLAYWASNKVLEIFSEYGKNILSNYSEAISKGIYTGDNERFIRNWFEVMIGDISNEKWSKYSKGGPTRKWYGNLMHVLRWQSNGAELKSFGKSGLGASKYFNKPHIVWTKVTTLNFTCRYDENYIFFDDVSPAIIFNEEVDYYIFGLMNSNVVNHILKILAPTQYFQIGDIRKIPVIDKKSIFGEQVKDIVNKCILNAKTDWDSFETSWDFKEHPLVNLQSKQQILRQSQDDSNGCHSERSEESNNFNTIEQSFNQWQDFTNEQFNQLKANEEELNRIFIDIYGLQDELTPEVEDKDITIRKADRERDIKSFISYAVGCMFGRYSLDEEGLIYAGGEFDLSRYKTFIPTMDNVIPIVDDDYFEDDIVNRFVEFVKATFGEKTLEENLDYIAETLGNKSGETSRQTIRRYFLKDFYTDHVRTYSKRPIYWMFDSGKNNGFKALVYMHRYNSSTVARVRTDYLHKLQRQYEAEVNHMDILLESEVSPREKAVAKKRKDNLNKQILECRSYDQVIAHIANQKIEIDLDDGVVVNYGKFQSVEIPQGEGKKPIKADLLGKI